MVPRKYAVVTNILIIIAVAFIGILIAYLFSAIFTKHGEEAKVPGVENMSYSEAIEKLYARGFNVDIRDSLYRDDVKPGYVIEQFPKANSIVKPGRKIFLYINAVHPKEVVIDDGFDRTSLALKDWSYRQAKSRLVELGFKNIRTVTVLGADDRVVKILAKGHPVFKRQKVAVNTPMIIEISDGRLGAVRDSLYDLERLRDLEYLNQYENSYSEEGNEGGMAGEGGSNVSSGESKEPEYFEEPEYFLLNE